MNIRFRGYIIWKCGLKLPQSYNANGLFSFTLQSSALKPEKKLRYNEPKANDQI